MVTHEKNVFGQAPRIMRIVNEVTAIHNSVRTSPKVVVIDLASQSVRRDAESVFFDACISNPLSPCVPYPNSSPPLIKQADCHYRGFKCLYRVFLERQEAYVRSQCRKQCFNFCNALMVVPSQTGKKKRNVVAMYSDAPRTSSRSLFCFGNLH